MPAPASEIRAEDAVAGRIEVMHLGFGMHVEHHIFPAMSPRHAPAVRRVLETRFPERYQSLPFGRALLRVFRTAHVYKNATTLIDPRTGREWHPLAPKSEEGVPLVALR